MHAVAPSASALTMSPPRRTPPSQMIWVRSPTACATGATSSIGAGAPSSWRPPWFDRAIASTPWSAASTASATVWMPFTTIGPFQTERIHSRSSQASAGSNWELTYSASDTAVEPSPTSRPTTLANRIGSARTNRHVQPGCRAPSTNVPSPILGGSENPRRTSRSRRPSTAVSTVTTSASNPAAAARAIISATSPRSRHTYTWNHNRAVPAAAATSSIDLVPSVERA